MAGIKSLPRHVVASTLLLLPVALVATSCAGSEVPSTTCRQPYSDCGGVCVDTETDAANCGACDAPCESGERCLAGQCTEAPGVGGGGGGGGDGGGGGPACGSGLTECDGSCVDLKTDPAHCGACGEACNEGRACSGGVCQSGCLDGLVDCAGSCVDLQADPAHCGACGHVCDPRQKCQAGTCDCSVEPSEELAIPLPRRVTGTTDGAEDTRWLPCTAPGAPDRTFRFTAPTTGTYYIDTFGSTYDTVLGVQRADGCDLIACNDDDEGGTGQSRLSLDLVEGETYLVVVSGANGATGDFTLRLSQPPVCMPRALDPGVPQHVTGETPDRGDLVQATCGGGGSPDALYAFTAPQEGRYAFQARAESSAAAMVTSVHEGTSCTGNQLGCGNGKPAFAALAAGQTVLVAVQSYDGGEERFTLDVLEEPPCPAEDLGATEQVSRTGDTSTRVDRYTIWCANRAGREATYRFTAPVAGRYLFDAGGSTAGTAVAVREDDGTCTGDDLGCDAGEDGTARVGVTLAAGQSVVVLVDTPGLSGGDFSLSVTRAENDGACASPVPLAPAVPQTVTGTTRGRPNETSSGMCKSTDGPDITYTFTAPEAGYYVFDTVGSSSATRIAAYEGTCAGRELACPSGEDAWAVGLALEAEQTVAIVVDSEDLSAGGDYTLNVDRLPDAGTCASPVALPPEVPQTVTGSTLGRPREVRGTCGPSSTSQRDAGPDMVFTFTAPRDGRYVFDTRGSAFDTVLHVHDGSCAGAQLACGDDIQAPIEKTSEASAALAAGQTVAIVVDGYNSSAGAFTLNVKMAD